jgi:peptidoglycan-associated lipoprotein
MNRINSRWVAIVLMIASLGCASRQPVTPPVNETSSAMAAPAPEPVPETPPTQSEDISSLLKAIVLHFALDEAVLTTEDQGQLRRLSDILKSHPSSKIRVVGHCDERGTEEYNLALGQRRAEVAKKYLVDLGVTADRVDTLSYGFERPLDPRHLEEAWAANRRDEFANTN